MIIPERKRPWQKTVHRNSRDKDPFYQSSTWKTAREGFINSSPLVDLSPINGKPYSNQYCAECWKSGRINSERIEIDHIIEVKDGGNRTDFRNLRSLCHAHHNSKTHQQRKIRRK